MSPGRTPYVIDTNVAIVANRRGGESYVCAAECAKRLIQIRQSGHVLLDQAGGILEEYRRHLRFVGQPGLGDAFFKWLIDNRHKPQLCTIVDTRVENGEYLDFPDTEELTVFDKSDRKFVAVTLTHGQGAPILQAADTKWWGWRAALQNVGVEVQFLCEREIAQQFKAKFEGD